MDLYISNLERCIPSLFWSNVSLPPSPYGNSHFKCTGEVLLWLHRFWSARRAGGREEMGPECQPTLSLPTRVPKGLCFSYYAAACLIFSKVLYCLSVILYTGPLFSILHYLNFFFFSSFHTLCCLLGEFPHIYFLFPNSLFSWV